MVDVTAMNSFQVGSEQTVRVGTGLHLIDLYNRLAAHGLAVPGGSCPTVGRGRPRPSAAGSGCWAGPTG